MSCLVSCLTHFIAFMMLFMVTDHQKFKPCNWLHRFSLGKDNSHQLLQFGHTASGRIALCQQQHQLRNRYEHIDVAAQLAKDFLVTRK